MTNTQDNGSLTYFYVMPILSCSKSDRNSFIIVNSISNVYIYIYIYYIVYIMKTIEN